MVDSIGSTTTPQMANIMNTYCTTVLNSDNAFVYNGDFVYSAQQSAFVYLLCNAPSSSKLSSEYFSLTSFKDL